MWENGEKGKRVREGGMQRKITEVSTARENHEGRGEVEEARRQPLTDAYVVHPCILLSTLPCATTFLHIPASTSESRQSPSQYVPASTRGGLM